MLQDEDGDLNLQFYSIGKSRWINIFQFPKPNDCGNTKISIIVDRSGSTFDAQQNMRDAANSIISMFSIALSRSEVQVVSFAATAIDETSGYSPLRSLTDIATVKTIIDNIGPYAGNTNWEAAFDIVLTLPTPPD